MFRSSRRRVRAACLAVTMAAFASTPVVLGCKQGEGEYCQITADCSDGLVCNPGTMRCQNPAGGGSDASPLDAPAADAAPTDAAPDGAPSDGP